MAGISENKSIDLPIEENLLSSKIHDYYELPPYAPEQILDAEKYYFAVKMQATLALGKDGKNVKGIQGRIVSAVRNSITGHCFAGYDLNDTFVSINMVSDKYSANIFNLRSLEQHIDKTACGAVRIFSGRLDNGGYKLAAKLEEKSAVLYVHKSALYQPAFEILAPFIKSECDIEWLVDEMQRIADYQAEVHF